MQCVHYHNQRIRSQVVDRNRSCFFERQRLRFFKQLCCIYHHQIRLTSKARHRTNGLANQLAANSIADSFNQSTYLITHHARLRRAVGIKTLTRQDVSEVQTGSLDANQYFAWARCGIRLLLNLEDMDVAGCGSNDLSHLAEYVSGLVKYVKHCRLLIVDF